MIPGLETPEQIRQFSIFMSSCKYAYMIACYKGFDEEKMWQQKWDEYRDQLVGEDLSTAVEAFDNRMKELNNG